MVILDDMSAHAHLCAKSDCGTPREPGARSKGRERSHLGIVRKAYAHIEHSEGTHFYITCENAPGLDENPISNGNPGTDECGWMNQDRELHISPQAPDALNRCVPGLRNAKSHGYLYGPSYLGEPSHRPQDGQASQCAAMEGGVIVQETQELLPWLQQKILNQGRDFSAMASAPDHHPICFHDRGPLDWGEPMNSSMVTLPSWEIPSDFKTRMMVLSRMVISNPKEA